MLMAATVMPIVFDTLTDVPDGASQAAAPVVALATMVTVVVLVLRAPPAWRLWSPIIGIAVGCAVAAPFGLYDVQPILDASWVGAPFGSWPGLDLSPGVEFWALLPAFVVVTLVGAIETVGAGVAIQRVLPTQAAGDRLPGGAGRPERRRRGQSAVRHRRNTPQYRPTRPASLLPRLRESPHGGWASLSEASSSWWPSSPSLLPC